MWQLADGEGGCPRGQRGSAEQLPGRGGTGPLPTSHPPSRRHRTCPAPRPRRRPGSPRALALLPFRVVVATRRGATTNARLISRRKPLPCMPREARRVRTASERSQKKKSLLRMGRCAVDGGWSKRRPAPPLLCGWGGSGLAGIVRCAERGGPGERCFYFQNPNRWDRI